MTAAESLMVRVADALAECAIPYMLSGIPRSTKDADFVVQLSGPLGKDFLSRLDDLFEPDPQLSFETNTGTYRQILKHRRSPFRVELFLLSADFHDRMRFQRRLEVAHFQRRLWLPTPEDVIIMKVRWARGRDQDDVRAVIGVQQDNLDWPYIENWCDRHGTRPLLEEIRRTVPKV